MPVNYDKTVWEPIKHPPHPFTVSDISEQAQKVLLSIEENWQNNLRHSVPLFHLNGAVARRDLPQTALRQDSVIRTDNAQISQSALAPVHNTPAESQQFGARAFTTHQRYTPLTSLPNFSSTTLAGVSQVSRIDSALLEQNQQTQLHTAASLQSSRTALNASQTSHPVITIRSPQTEPPLPFRPDTNLWQQRKESFDFEPDRTSTPWWPPHLRSQGAFTPATPSSVRSPALRSQGAFTPATPSSVRGPSWPCGAFAPTIRQQYKPDSYKFSPTKATSKFTPASTSTFGAERDVNKRAGWCGALGQSHTAERSGLSSPETSASRSPASKPPSAVRRLQFNDDWSGLSSSRGAPALNRDDHMPCSSSLPSPRFAPLTHNVNTTDFNSESHGLPPPTRDSPEMDFSSDDEGLEMLRSLPKTQLSSPAGVQTVTRQPCIDVKVYQTQRPRPVSGSRMREPRHDMNEHQTQRPSLVPGPRTRKPRIDKTVHQAQRPSLVPQPRMHQTSITAFFKSSSKQPELLQKPQTAVTEVQCNTNPPASTSQAPQTEAAHVLFTQTIERKDTLSPCINEGLLHIPQFKETPRTAQKSTDGYVILGSIDLTLDEDPESPGETLLNHLSQSPEMRKTRTTEASNSTQNLQRSPYFENYQSPQITPGLISKDVPLLDQQVISPNFDIVDELIIRGSSPDMEIKDYKATVSENSDTKKSQSKADVNEAAEAVQELANIVDHISSENWEQVDNTESKKCLLAVASNNTAAPDTPAKPLTLLPSLVSPLSATEGSRPEAMKKSEVPQKTKRSTLVDDVLNPQNRLQSRADEIKKRLFLTELIDQFAENLPDTKLPINNKKKLKFIAPFKSQTATSQQSQTSVIQNIATTYCQTVTCKSPAQQSSPLSEQSTITEPPAMEQLASKITKFDFKSLQLLLKQLQREPPIEVCFTLIYRQGLCQLSSATELKQNTEQTAPAAGLLLSVMGQNSTLMFYQLSLDKHKSTFSSERAIIERIMLTPCRKVCFQTHELFSALIDMFQYTYNEVVLKWVVMDPLIGCWLINPDEPPADFPSTLVMLGINQSEEYNMKPLEKIKLKLVALSKAVEVMYHRLMDCKLWRVFIDLETPITSILAAMAMRGVLVNVNILRDIGNSLEKRMKTLQFEANKIVGSPVLLTSPQQLRKILFEKLKLDTKIKIPKTVQGGVKSTSEAVLKMLEPLHPLPGLILEFRQLQKLNSTYVDGLVSHVADGRLRTVWVQTAAATGRLASRDPNVQAIPKQPVTVPEGETRRQLAIRSAFHSKEGCSFLTADFQHVELRLMAHYTQDPTLTAMFAQNDEDVFVLLARQWFGLSHDQEVSYEDREKTKRVVYAVMYGAGMSRLEQVLSVDKDEAKKLINSFTAKFPQMKRLQQRVIHQAKTEGYITSLSGRRRVFSNINSNDANLRLQSERQAVNFLLQGSAADVCKAAMLATEKARQIEACQAEIILQIHDELVWEVPDEQLDQFTGIAQDAMEGTRAQFKLEVPLPVKFASGKTWNSLS